MALIFVGKPDIDPDFFLEENRHNPTAGDSTTSYDLYDSFLFGKKKKRRLTPEEKAIRKQKRKAFWSNLGKNVQQSGGAEGLGKTVDNIVNLFSKNKEVPEDYSFELANVQAEPEKQRVPTSVFVIGGAVLLGIAGLGYMMYQNKKG